LAGESRLLIYHLADNGKPKLSAEAYTSCESIYGVEHIGWLPYRAEVIAAWNSQFGRKQELEIYSLEGKVLFRYSDHSKQRPGPDDLYELEDIQISDDSATVCLVYSSGKIRVYNAKNAEDFKQVWRVLRYPAAIYQHGAFASDARWFFVGGWNLTRLIRTRGAIASCTFGT
jgi:hypothetical protein